MNSANSEVGFPRNLDGATLSQQVAILRKYLRDEVDQLQLEENDDVPSGSNSKTTLSSHVERATSSHDPIVVLENDQLCAGHPADISHTVAYSKLKTCSDMSGEMYEVKMVLLLFLRGINGTRRFYIGANMDAAGQFDDVVYKIQLTGETDWTTNFIQLKHKRRAKVTLSAMLSLRKNDFGLVKYCHSYLGVKGKKGENKDLQFCGKFEKINFIIYTNAFVDKDLVKPDRRVISGMNTCLINTSNSSNGMIFSLDPFLDGVVYQALEEIVSLKDLLQDLDCCFKSDRQERVVHLTDLLRSFFVSHRGLNSDLVQIVDKLKKNPSHDSVTLALSEDFNTVADFPSYLEFTERLQMFTGQASVNELDHLITRELVNALKIANEVALRKIFVSLMGSIQDWWSSGAFFLTENAEIWKNVVTTRISELSFKTLKKLQELNLEFTSSSLHALTQAMSGRVMLNVMTREGSSSLTLLKVYQTVSALNNHCGIFIDLESLMKNQVEVLHAWQNKWCHMLVLDCGCRPTSDVPTSLATELYELLKHSRDLSLVLVATQANAFADLLVEALVFEEYDNVNQWSQLSQRSQSTLLSKAIMFQGHPIPLRSVLADNEHLNALLNGAALSQLIHDDVRMVGSALESPVEYYVPRCLTLKDAAPVAVASAYDLEDRVVLVTAEPGMGKSTLLTCVAAPSKRENPAKWIVRINLNDCTEHLAHLKKASMQEIDSVKFVMKSVLTNATTLEHNLFKHYLQMGEELVALIDGVDEVCPYYEAEVCLLLRHLLQTKIEKLWVASRATLREKLEHTLCVSSYSLVPFSKIDQENFLNMYWSSKIGGEVSNTNLICGNNFEGLQSFTRRVLCIAADTFGNDSLITSIPQQTLMLAEMFETDIVNYCKETIPLKLPKRLDLADLYERFVQNKFELYAYEKKKVSRDSAVVMADIENTKKTFLMNHMAASVALLFPVDERPVPAVPDVDMVQFLDRVKDGREKSGIVVGVNNGLPRFIHRTFAEYFVAVWFKENFVSMQELLIKKLFDSKFEVVKNFFNRLLARDCSLHQAVLDRDEQTVRELLATGSDVDSRDYGGRTALHLVADSSVRDSHGDCVSIATILLDHGATVNIVDAVFSWNPLRYADQVGAWRVGRLFVRKGGNVDDLVVAKRNMQSEVFDQFICHMKENEFNCAHLMLAASKHGDLGIMRYLLNHWDADVNCRGVDGVSAMHKAAEGGQVQMMRFLHERGASYVHGDARNNIPLHSAVVSGQLEAIRILIEEGSPIDAGNDDGWSPLMLASKFDMVVVARCLVEHGADVNARNENGWSPLLCAAQSGRIEGMRFLVESGAEVNVSAVRPEVLNSVSLLCVGLMKNINNVQCLTNRERLPEVADVDEIKSQGELSTTSETNVQLAKELVKNQADVNYCNDRGMSALHFAILSNRYDLMKYFVENGADVHKCDIKGQGPLHYVAMIGTKCANLSLLATESKPNHLEMLRTLIEKGVNISARTNDGKSFRSLVWEMNHSDIIKYFLPLDNKLIDAFKARDMFEIKQLVESGAYINPLSEHVQSMLTMAAKEGNLPVLSYLLENGADVNTCDGMGQCLLLTAAVSKSWEAVKYLVNCGADCNAVGNDGRSVLHIMSSNLDAVKLLFERGADIDTRDIYGNTPLLCAAYDGCRETVMFFVENGTNVEVVDGSGRSVFHIACDSCDVTLAQYLVSNGCNVHSSNAHGWTPLMSASNRGTTEVVQFLLTCGVDVDATNKQGQRALHAACSLNTNMDIVELLVTGGADVNKRDYSGQSPILHAAENKSWDVVKCLIELGGDVHDCDGLGTSLLHLASRDVDVVKLLIGNGVNVNAYDRTGQTPLLAAAFVDSWDVVELLANGGAEVQVVDAFGYTPLHMAADAKNLQAMLFLMNKGAKVNTRNRDGMSPLMSAVYTSSWDVAKLLISKGADIEEVDSYGRSVFHVVSDCKQLEMMSLLFDQGANVHCSDASKWTPLMSAVRDECLEVVLCLLDFGVRVEALDQAGNSALHIACTKENLEMVVLLIDRGSHGNVYRDRMSGRLIKSAARNKAWNIVKMVLDNPSSCQHSVVYKSEVMWAIKTGLPEILNYVSKHKSDFSPADEMSEPLNEGVALNAREEVVQPVKSESCSRPTNIDVLTLLNAAFSGSVAAVKYLLEHGADPNARDENGQMALLMAARGGHVNVAKCLVEHGADIHGVNKVGRSVLFEAAFSGSVSVLQFLIENGADVGAYDKDGRSALFDAAAMGNIEAVEYLSKNGVDIHHRDSENRTALFDAVVWGNLVVIRHLIEQGLDISATDRRGRTCLYDAVTWGRIDVMKYLVSQGADPNAFDNDGMSVLYSACMLDSTDLVVLQCLLELGADPNLCDKEGRSPIFKLASFPNSKGVDTNIRHGHEESYLFAEASVSSVEKMKCLVEHGADLNVRDSKGRTVIFQPAHTNWVSMVKNLLENGIDPNIQDNDGRTVLFGSAAVGALAVVRCLIEHGANPHICDKESRTPIMVAHRDVKAVLISLTTEKV